MKLCAGIDLCDDYIIVYVTGAAGARRFPAVISRDRRTDEWYLGEEAYASALSGKGILTDRLLTMLERGGTATLARHTYSGAELVGRLVKEALEQQLQGAAVSDLDRLVIAIRRPDPRLMELLTEAVEDIGINRSRIGIVSHSEALIRFVMSQDRNLFMNSCAVFDLSDEKLYYYEMKVLRGSAKPSVAAAGEAVETSFRTDILSSESGRRLADRIMRDSAERLMKGGIYSAVFLTGKGFQSTDWAKEFLAFVCTRRRVLYHDGLFAQGACIAAETAGSSEEEAYTLLCDTSLEYELSVKVRIRGRDSKLILASPGDRWFGRRVHAELIPLDQDYVDVELTPVDPRKKSRLLRLPLTDFPERERGCTALSLEADFPGPGELSLSLKDLGFGEIFPASGAEISREVEL